MSDSPTPRPEIALPDAMARLEQRLCRLEQHLGLPPLPGESPTTTPAPTTMADDLISTVMPEKTGEELEFVVGQSWFAGVGVTVLTCGIGFALSLPYAGLPAAVPSAGGFLLAAGLLLAARLGRQSFELLAGHLRGAGMALMFFATLRLFYFSATPVLDLGSAGGRLVLVLAVVGNLVLALRRKSPWLLGLAMVFALVAALLVGTALWVGTTVALLAGLAAYASVRYSWPGFLLAAVPALYLTHLLWAINRPWAGRPFKVLHDPVGGVMLPLLYLIFLAVGSLRRRDRSHEDSVTILTILLNCGAGYALFLLQSLGLTSSALALVQSLAAFIYLALAVAFWRSEASRIGTFFHAMTGYLALSVAIIKAFPVPEVFIWLSGQSLVVVATALWFRSRLIVVANFFIYVGIVVAYMVVTKSETGISLGLGVVALLTARALNWKKERLELHTELMRNAYLACAFVVFPYALYHLVPKAYVSVAWVGVALLYYTMNLIVQNPKYRWLGHLTLLLTVGYVIIAGVTRLSPTYRIVSFLVLGTVLLAVSLAFTRVRARRKQAAVKDAFAGAGTQALPK